MFAIDSCTCASFYVLRLAMWKWRILIRTWQIIKWLIHWWHSTHSSCPWADLDITYLNKKHHSFFSPSSIFIMPNSCSMTQWINGQIINATATKLTISGWWNTGWLQTRFQLNFIHVIKLIFNWCSSIFNLYSGKPIKMMFYTRVKCVLSRCHWSNAKIN